MYLLICPTCGSHDIEPHKSSYEFECQVCEDTFNQENAETERINIIEEGEYDTIRN